VFDPHLKKARYGLPRPSLGPALKAQLDQLYDMLVKTPISVTRRFIGWDRQQGRDTWHNKIRNPLLGFLGFVHLYFGTQPEQLDLHKFADLNALFVFWSFLFYHRQVSPAELKVHLDLAAKMQVFIAMGTQPGSQSMPARGDQAMAAARERQSYLAHLSKELGSQAQRYRGQRLEHEAFGSKPCSPPTQLPDPGALLAWWRARVEALLRRVAARGMNTEWACDARDLLLFSFLFSPMGAMRPASIATLKAPEYSSEPCTHDGCLVGGCCGNRVQLEPTCQAGTTDVVVGYSYRVAVPHHKNSLRGRPGSSMVVEHQLMHCVQSTCEPSKPEKRTASQGATQRDLQTRVKQAGSRGNKGRGVYQEQWAHQSANLLP
jgi:hypothetical protein